MEANPYGGPTCQVGEYSFPGVQRHNTLAEEEEQAEHRQARPLSALREKEVGGPAQADGQESCERRNSFEVESKKYLPGGFEWLGGRWHGWIERMAPRRRGGPFPALQVASAWLQLLAMGWPFLRLLWTTSLL